MLKAETKYSGVGSAAVRTKTGKDWDEWIKVLDGEDAANLPHKEIARLLSTKYKVPDWWCQMITVGYEQARGRRAVHEKADGFSANASKTLNASLSVLYAACADEGTRAKWVGRKRYRVSKATPHKSLRFGWGKNNATRVDLNLYARGETKSQLAIQHSKLANADEAAQMKAFWKDALDKLAELLEA